MGLVVEETTAPYNIGLVLFGLALFAVRIFSMRAFILSKSTAKHLKVDENYPDRFEGWFSPVVHHASFYISMLFSFALIFSFRVKILNAMVLAVLPSVFISVPGKDLPILFHPEDFNTTRGTLYWWNYVTIHIPLLFMGIYIIIMRNYLFSEFGFWIAFIIIQVFFFGLDDKDNGVLNGKKYIQSALLLSAIWITIIYLAIIPGLPVNVDPLIAPVYSVTFG